MVTAPSGAYEYNIDGGTWQASVTFAGVSAGITQYSGKKYS